MIKSNKIIDREEVARLSDSKYILVFDHIPKCAGRTIKYILDSCIAKSKALDHLSDLTGFNMDESFDCFMGHYSWGIHEVYLVSAEF
ncbi:hypothetical protein, partial [Desulfamplus magnetovallimortis]|uniref:hypothetical protein n=1 Tax=Desulfamplus magnetovallimortis TaxID=1246637 RepID=UPI00111A7DC6